MITQSLQIEGMSCGHCVQAVRKALSGLEGVTVASVSVGAAQVELTSPSQLELIRSALDEEGYALKVSTEG